MEKRKGKMKVKKRIVFIGFIVGATWGFLLKNLTFLPSFAHWVVLILGCIPLGYLVVWIANKREKHAKK